MGSSGNPIPEHDGEDRPALIASVISAELDRQAERGAARIDVMALAEAIEAAIGAMEPAPPGIESGRRPQDLNATNDD